MLKGLGDMGRLMQQAQQMQTRMQEAQERIAGIEAEGVSGGGLVRATAAADGTLRRLTVDPSLLDGREEHAVLEDLIVAAVNDAVGRARELGQREMAKVTEGLALPPGFKLPFG